MGGLGEGVRETAVTVPLQSFLAGFFFPDPVLAVVASLALFSRMGFPGRGQRLTDLLPDRFLSPMDWMCRRASPLMDYKTIISAFPVSGQKKAMVLLPVSQPPVSPGLMIRVLPLFWISGL